MLSSCAETEDVAPATLSATSNNALVRPPGGCILYTPEAMINNYGSKSAKDLAKILAQNPAARSVLGTEAGKRLDGDYDVLFSTLKNKAVGTTTFQALLDQARAANGGWGEMPTSEGSSEHNRLIVSIPVNYEKWSTTAAPLVAFVPYAFNDQVHTTVQAYNAQGGVVTLSTLTDPTQPVVVVSIGERIAADGTIRPEFVPKTLVQRVVGAGEYLTGLQCTNLGAIEPWVRGAPELRLYIGSARLTSTSTTTQTVAAATIKNKVLYDPKRSDIKDKMWVRDDALFTWTNDYSDYYTMQWLEEDGGPTVAFEMSVTPKFGEVQYASGTLKIDFSKWENDDEIGSVEIYRNDPDGAIAFGSIFTAKVTSKP